MNQPLESSVDELHDFIHSEVHRKREDLSIDLDNHVNDFGKVRDILTPTESDDYFMGNTSFEVESDAESDLISKMRQLRKDISKNNLSAAFGSFVEPSRNGKIVRFDSDSKRHPKSCRSN